MYNHRCYSLCNLWNGGRLYRRPRGASTPNTVRRIIRTAAQKSHDPFPDIRVSPTNPEKFEGVSRDSTKKLYFSIQLIETKRKNTDQKSHLVAKISHLRLALISLLALTNFPGTNKRFPLRPCSPDTHSINRLTNQFLCWYDLLLWAVSVAY